MRISAASPNGILDPATGSWAPLRKSLAPTGSDGRPLVVDERVLIDDDPLDPGTLVTARSLKLPGPMREAATMIAGPEMIMV